VTTNGETHSALGHVTVPRRSPSQSCWAVQEPALEFGRFQMLLRRRQLFADGVPVKLGTRALDLLLVLLTADGSLVAKEKLVYCVWPGVHVSEENLKVQISGLRKALGEDRAFIETEIGRGYRFTAAVKSTAPWNPSRHAARPWQRPRQSAVSRWMRVRSFPECSDRNASRSTVAKSRLCKALALTVSLGLTTFSYTAHAALAGGSSTVQGLYDALLSTMTSGRRLGESGRFAQLAPVIRSAFEVASMARLSVGPRWTGLSEAQRQEVTESCGRYISAIYTDRFDSYNGEKLEATGEQPAQFRLLVKSRITKSDGIDGLIAALNRKADILTGTTARSF